jgi:hypothetical protein
VKSLCNKPRFFGFHTAKPENTTLTLRGFDKVRPRPLRGPRTSTFDEVSTWGYVQGPNRLEPSSVRTSSAMNTALRNARTAPRFAPISGGSFGAGFAD